MPTKVEQLPYFERQLERLHRRFPKTLDTVLLLIEALERGERPGDRLRGIGYTVYKARLPNRAARGEHVIIESTLEQPSALPAGLADGELDA